MKFESINRKLEFVTTVMCAAFVAFVVFQHTPQQNYRAKLSLGSRFLKEENYEKAEAAFRDAIRIDDKKPEPYIGLGSSYAGQADMLLVKYQNEVSGAEGSTAAISEEEKENLENLYKKAKKAFRDASDRDEKNSIEIDQTVSYVDIQKKKAEKLSTDTDSIPATTITPAPPRETTSDSEENKSLEDMVNTEGGNTITLQENTSIGTIDIDGDGNADTMTLLVQKNDDQYVTDAKIEINGQDVKGLEEVIEKYQDVIDFQMTILQMNDGETFFTIDAEVVDVGNVADFLYKYHDGSFVEVTDLIPIDDTGYSSYFCAAFDFSAVGNTIQYRMGCNTASMAGTVIKRTILCHDGKAEFLSPEGEIDPAPEAYDTLKETLRLYKTGDPKTDKEASEILEKGTRCKITKAYFTNGTHLQRFYLTTDDGRSGWFDQGVYMMEDGYDRPLFENRYLPGGGF